MKIDLLAFGIAKDILKSRSLPVELPEGGTVGDLKEKLVAKFPGFQKLKSLAIAVNTEYRDDDFSLSENDEVVIIPPVSGG